MKRWLHIRLCVCNPRAICSWRVQRCHLPRAPPQPVNLTPLILSNCCWFQELVRPQLKKYCKCASRTDRSKVWMTCAAVRGIGPKRIEKMSKYLTVGKAAAPQPASVAAASGAKPKPPPAKAAESKTATVPTNSGNAKPVTEPDSTSTEDRRALVICLILAWPGNLHSQEWLCYNSSTDFYRSK